MLIYAELLKTYFSRSKSWLHGFEKKPTRLVVFLVIYLTLSACSSFGTDRVAPDRFDYNLAVGRSANEQMLLNLVRLRYRDVPVFLSINSVLSQYVYLGNANISGLGGAVESVGGGIGFTYEDRPTITYSPLTGEEFARQLLTPIPSQSIFSLAQSGWPAEQLMLMSFERINHLKNISFGQVLTRQQIKQMEKFELAVKLIVALSKRNAIESHLGSDRDKKSNYLVFDQTPDIEINNYINKLKKILTWIRKFPFSRLQNGKLIENRIK